MNKLSQTYYTLKNMTTLKDIPFLADNPMFRYLASVADISALSQKEQRKYDEESIKIMQDNISAYETVINKGRREGLKEGLSKGEAKGRAEGLIKGEEKGLRKGAIQTDRRMKAKVFTLDVISEMTGLSLEEIDSL